MDPYGTETVIEDEIHDPKPSEDIEDDDDKSQPHSGGGVDSAGWIPQAFWEIWRDHWFCDYEG